MVLIPFRNLCKMLNKRRMAKARKKENIRNWRWFNLGGRPTSTIENIALL